MGWRVKYLDISQTFFGIFLLFVVQFDFIFFVVVDKIRNTRVRSAVHARTTPACFPCKSVLGKKVRLPPTTKPRGPLFQKIFLGTSRRRDLTKKKSDSPFFLFANSRLLAGNYRSIDFCNVYTYIYTYIEQSLAGGWYVFQVGLVIVTVPP